MILQSFKKGFDEVIQKYVQSKNTPVKPSKKKAKGRVEKTGSYGNFKQIQYFVFLKMKTFMSSCWFEL